MRVLIINEYCGHTSTGKICAGIVDEYEQKGNEVRIAFGRDGFVPEKYKKNAYRIGNDFDVRLHGILTRLFDAHGLASRFVTQRFLKWADKYSPNLLWLHNLHGYYINYEMLFSWIKKHPEMTVYWTLHDCWAFTGHCTHFTYVGCCKWEHECNHCPQLREYPASLFIDRSKKNFTKKKRAFLGVSNLTIITPSEWLKGLVKRSFLGGYPIEVRYNSIDKNLFTPTESNFRKEYNLEDKFIILGVANVWNERKGINDFISLASLLDDRFAIVVVGLDEKQIKTIQSKISILRQKMKQTKANKMEHPDEVLINPDETICYKNGILVKPNVQHLYQAIYQVAKKEPVPDNTNCQTILLQRTKNQKSLAELYSTADVFVNPTYEDTYPTVNLEAIACGTYVISYDSCGCKETLK